MAPRITVFFMSRKRFSKTRVLRRPGVGMLPTIPGGRILEVSLGTSAMTVLPPATIQLVLPTGEFDINRPFRPRMIVVQGVPATGTCIGQLQYPGDTNATGAFSGLPVLLSPAQNTMTLMFPPSTPFNNISSFGTAIANIRVQGTATVGTFNYMARIYVELGPDTM
jgi:hypothetical protein